MISDAVPTVGGAVTACPFRSLESSLGGVWSVASARCVWSLWLPTVAVWFDISQRCFVHEEAEDSPTDGEVTLRGGGQGG